MSVMPTAWQSSSMVHQIQYVVKNGRASRKKSGYSSKLLKVTETALRKKGITIPMQILNIVGDSTEETVMASSEQGSWGEIIVPVQAAGNTGEFMSTYHNLANDVS